MPPGERSIPLDVTRRRARLEGALELTWQGGEATFDHVELDTGLSLDVLVPRQVAPAQLLECLAPTDALQTLGGEVACDRAEGFVRLDGGCFVEGAEIHMIDQPGGVVLLGLPLLRKFDLLLRDLSSDPRRPRMAYTPTV